MNFRVKALESISVFGLGKLGACIAATLAARGFEVLGVDIDPDKVSKMNAGLPPVEEPLLAETILEGRSRLRATLNPREAIATDASFFIPPSPSLPDGSFSNEHLLKAMYPLIKFLREADKRNHLFVVNSTTTPGAVRDVIVPMLEKETGWKCPQDFGVCYNPEFIALGNVIRGIAGAGLGADRRIRSPERRCVGGAVQRQPQSTQDRPDVDYQRGAGQDRAQ